MIYKISSSQQKGTLKITRNFESTVEYRESGFLLTALEYCSIFHYKNCPAQHGRSVHKICGYNLDLWSSNHPYVSLVPSLITISSEKFPIGTLLSGLGSRCFQVGGCSCYCWAAGKGQAMTYCGDNLH